MKVRATSSSRPIRLHGKHCPKTVVLDFDSTIAESMESMFEHQRFWNVGSEPLIYNPTHRAAVEEHDHADRMWTYFHSDMGIRRVRPKAGAIDAINRLIAAGYTVFVLTDRKKQSFDALIQWFAERGTHMPPSQFHLIITDEVITKQAVV